MPQAMIESHSNIIQVVESKPTIAKEKSKRKNGNF